MANSDFAIFIMVHGRPEKNWTERYLRESGYTGEIYFLDDELDEKKKEYKQKYGDKVIMVDTAEVAKGLDTGDNTGDLRSTLFKSNEVFKIAERLDVKYFMLMCDDYTSFRYTFGKPTGFNHRSIKNLDKVISALLDFYKSTPTTTIAMAQAGDLIGGKYNRYAKDMFLRKAMNTFLCSTDRPFKFFGRLNEDVTTYVLLGSQGKLFFTAMNLLMIQQESQSQKGGLTDVYLDQGTYVKSFFSVMYSPSCVKVSTMGRTTEGQRVHHHINWENAVPKILRERAIA